VTDKSGMIRKWSWPVLCHYPSILPEGREIAVLITSIQVKNES